MQEAIETTKLLTSQGGSNPLDYISFFDVGLMFLGIIIRVTKSLKEKANQYKEAFKISAYFDAVHVLNWILHLSVSTALVLVLPEIFVEYVVPKYLGEFHLSAAAVSGLIGFFGYDLIKIIGKIISLWGNKKGINID